MSETKSSTKPSILQTAVMPGGMPPVVGRLAGPGDAGEVLVQFDGRGPKKARLLAGLSRKALTDPQKKGGQVLLLFENNDPEFPIIIGLIQSPLEDLVSLEVAPPEVAQKRPTEARLDGRRVVLEAQDEIQLKCGKGSITIKRDGKIVVKGTHLLSRATGPHRIKGGNVTIN